jgi:UDP-N-acetyl-D-galactosamine dehydrogenase
VKRVKIAVVGLGYVGLPLAHLFASKYDVVGFDIDTERVAAIMMGNDKRLELSHGELIDAIENGFHCTSNIDDIRDCNIYIVAVPTPVDKNNHIDIRMLLDACQMVGSVVKKGDIVVFESTVYPGMTEEECIPAIEASSGLRCNKDFFVGYSPERINPGDKTHGIANVVKIVSGSTPQVAAEIERVYGSVVVAGIHLAPSIRVAEAAKIIENTQRDVNIAFINEMAKVFNAMGLDTHDVIEAAQTKWNFVAVEPGLVGGHCIAVDPYYLIEKAQVYGVMPHVVSSARRLNDGMGEYVATEVIKLMSKNGIAAKGSKILLLGITFKENCPDIRGSKVVDIYKTLLPYTTDISIYDPKADASEVRRLFGIDIIDNSITEMKNCFDAVVLCVAHDEFMQLDIRSLLKPSGGVVYDVKGRLPREKVDMRL